MCFAKCTYVVILRSISYRTMGERGWISLCVCVCVCVCRYLSTSSASASGEKFVVCGAGAGGLAVAARLGRTFGEGSVTIVDPAQVSELSPGQRTQSMLVDQAQVSGPGPKLRLGDKAFSWRYNISE